MEDDFLKNLENDIENILKDEKMICNISVEFD